MSTIGESVRCGRSGCTDTYTRNEILAQKQVYMNKVNQDETKYANQCYDNNLTRLHMVIATQCLFFKSLHDSLDLY